MEKILPLLLPALLGLFTLRLLLLPMKWGCRLLLHAGAGFLGLWLLNLTAPVTGILFPINALTVLTAGTLGLPGIMGMAVLGIM